MDDRDMCRERARNIRADSTTHDDDDDDDDDKHSYLLHDFLRRFHFPKMLLNLIIILLPLSVILILHPLAVQWNCCNIKQTFIILN